MRPKTLDEYIGQKHLVGQGAILRQMIESGNIASFILWGPPGVGKTTLARIIAHQLQRPFYTLSAVTSGVKEVRDVIDKAKRSSAMNSGLFAPADGRSPILFIDEIHRFSKSQQDSLLGAVEEGTITLFIDEIHRFSKSQQDSLLGAVEEGTITLVGATTENPSFEVITPLLSRCQVYVLKSLDKDDLMELLNRVLTKDEYIRSLGIQVKENEALLRFSGGDARKLLNIIELVANSGVKIIDNETVTKQLQQNPVAYDKDGEMHYDIISAFIKSVRGSDPQAAIYWLARMIEGGEDPKFIARRLVILASEDIGLANPNAMLLANTCFDVVNKIGWPEGRIPLAETTIYLATCKKDNSAYLAIDEALAKVRETGNLPVPLHLRNAPTSLMKDLGYHDGYLYPHDFPNHWVEQQYLPDELVGTEFWKKN